MNILIKYWLIIFLGINTRRGGAVCCMLSLPLFTMWRDALLCLLVFCVVIVCEAAQIQGKVMTYTLCE